MPNTPKNNAAVKGLQALSKTANKAQAEADAKKAEAAAAAETEALLEEKAAAVAEAEAAVEAVEAASAPAPKAPMKSLAQTGAAPVEARIDDQVQAAGDAAEEAAEEAPEKEEYYFVSTHPEIVVFIDVPGRHELDRSGNPSAVSTQAAFKNGVFRTTDYTTAALLDERAASMAQMFRRERNPRALAVLQEAHKASALLKSGVVGGISTAGDDNPQEAAKAQAHLKALRNKTYNEGVV